MKKTVLRFISLVISLIMAAAVCLSCSNKEDSEIVIYSSSEDYRNEKVLSGLKEKFPDYNIKLEYVSTGDLAQKILNEGKNTECDIILELESTYMAALEDNVCKLDDYVDFSKYLDELVPESHRYVPWCKVGSTVVVNKDVLEENDLEVPESYDDLLKPEYKGYISMANPASSGTGYVFLHNMVATRGDDEAYKYFDELSKNINQFTKSGSGPMQALTSKEAAIGFCMVWQAVSEINNGYNLELLFFDEGVPYTTYSSAIIEGKQKDEKVVEVFDYIVKTLTPQDKELFLPEQIYKDQEINVENFPSDIKYADMKGLTDVEYKEKILDKWNY